MATKNLTIHQKGKQLTYNDFLEIAACLNRGLNLTDTAKYLHCHVSTVKREIDRHKQIKIYTLHKNLCGFQKICRAHHVCGNSNCNHLCSQCTMPRKTCNEYCSQFTLEPQCKRIKRLGGVCNGCELKCDCKLNKYFYDPNYAFKEHRLAITECKKGHRISKDELTRLAIFLKPFIHKHISLDAIKHKYPFEVPYSIQSIYNWINLNLLPGITNLDLPKKCRYKVRLFKQKPPKNDFRHLEGRLYDDFLSYITENPNIEVVEMDTVEGANKESFILTLLFRRSNYMLAFKLLDHSANSVTKVFNMIKDTIGIDKFKQFFPVILTDRGIEFIKPLDIEFDSNTGEKLTSIFYCDSRQSQQKGKIEKNHEELRKISPKGFDFNTISQNDLNLALCHVNSYPRKVLNYVSPIHIFKSYMPKLMLDLTNAFEVSFENIHLTPKLIKK